MCRNDLTTHGFRSTFRDSCGDETEASREIAEVSLAHKTRDSTELAYRRNQAFAKRRKLMAEWADYCNKPQLKAVG
jgi:integrase